MSNEPEHLEAEGSKNEKTITIYVNTRPKEVVDDKELTFTDIVNLAYNNSPPTGEYIVFTVLYRRKNSDNQVSLNENEVVKVKEGMIFDVTHTDKS